MEFHIGFYTFSIEYIFLLSATTKNEKKNPTQIRIRKNRRDVVGGLEESGDVDMRDWDGWLVEGESMKRDDFRGR